MWPVMTLTNTCSSKFTTFFDYYVCKFEQDNDSYISQFIGKIQSPQVMSQTLTKYAIRLINNENNHLQPHLQVFGIAPFGQGTQATNRYKLELYDGLHLQKQTFPRKFNDLILSDEIQKGSIIHVTHYSIPTICKSR